MYEMLLSPMKIGSMTVKNRTVMTAAEFSLGQTNGKPTERLMDYYEERAKGGVGMIIPGICRVNDMGGAGVCRAHPPPRGQALHPTAPPRAAGHGQRHQLPAPGDPHCGSLPRRDGPGVQVHAAAPGHGGKGNLLFRSGALQGGTGKTRRHEDACHVQA